MKKSTFLTNKMKWLFVPLVLLTLGVSNAWGADETLTLTKTDWSTGSYSTSTGSKSTGTTSIGLSWTDTYQNNDGIQMKKNTGEVHSTSYPSTNNKIKSIKVDFKTNTAYAYGSANGSDWTEISIEDNETKDVSSSNYKYWKVTSTSAYCVLNSITIVYTTGTPASKYTVKFNTGTGNPSQSDITEATAGAGITLPSVTPTCSTEGWALYGWATSACSSETSTAPTIVGKPGDTYKPSVNNTTLYAVYAKGEYTKETSSITSGSKYLIVASSGGHNHIMKSSSDDFQDYSGYNGMAAIQIDETSSNKYHAASVNATWCYSIEGTAGNYFIRDVVNSSSSNYADIAYASWWGHTIDNSDKYTITVSSGNWTIRNNYYDEGYSYLGYDSSDDAFFAYGSAQNILLYKAGSISYYSNPTCASCDANPTIGAASLNGTFKQSNR